MRMNAWLFLVYTMVVSVTAGSAMTTGTKAAVSGHNGAAVQMAELSTQDMQNIVGGSNECSGSKSGDWACGGCCVDLWLFSVCVYGCVWWPF